MTHALHDRLQHQYSYAPDGKPLSLCERMRRWPEAVKHELGGYGFLKYRRDPEARETVSATARMAGDYFEGLPRCSIKDAAKDELVQSTSEFLQDIRSDFKADETVKKCARALNAYLLGIPTQCFDERVNPGFEKFVSKPFFGKRTHLAQELLHYDQTLEVAADFKVSIRMNGDYVPWETARVEAEKKPDGTVSERYPERWNPAWRYGQDGVQTTHSYAWTVAKPYKVVANHPWGDQYIFEICSTCQGKFRAWGDHTWFRLKTPQGEVYSFGKYRSDDRFAHGWEQQPADWQSPDLTEFWEGIEEIHTMPFKITQKQFEKMISKAEQLHGDQKEVFNVASSTNCTSSTLEFAKMIGIDIDAKINFPYLLLVERFPSEIEGMIWMFQQDFSPTTQAITRNIAYPLFLLANCVQAWNGGMRVSEWMDPSTQVRPHIGSCLELLSPSKTYMPAPYMLVHHVFPRIRRWRATKESREGQKAGTFQYMVPHWLKKD